MGAAILSTPELALNTTESKAYADAVRTLAEFYPVAIDAKKMAVINLAVVMAGIYGTRFVAITMRKKVASDKRGPQLVERPEPARPAGGPTIQTAQLPSELWPQSGVVTGAAVGVV